MKNIILIAPLFLFLITCISSKHGEQKEYEVLLKRPKDTISIKYVLDTSYKEMVAILDLWATETARKYKKENEVIIEFYHSLDKNTDNFLKIGAEKRHNRYGLSKNPYAIIEEYSTKFNEQKGYFTKSEINSNKDFVLSYCTVSDMCETVILVSMLGNNLKNEDELIFKSLIESFTFQKK